MVKVFASFDLILVYESTKWASCWACKYSVYIHVHVYKQLYYYAYIMLKLMHWQKDNEIFSVLFSINSQYTGSHVWCGRFKKCLSPVKIKHCHVQNLCNIDQKIKLGRVAIETPNSSSLAISECLYVLTIK